MTDTGSTPSPYLPGWEHLRDELAQGQVQGLMAQNTVQARQLGRVAAALDEAGIATHADGRPLEPDARVRALAALRGGGCRCSERIERLVALVKDLADQNAR